MIRPLFGALNGSQLDILLELEARKLKDKSESHSLKTAEDQETLKRDSDAVSKMLNYSVATVS